MDPRQTLSRSTSANVPQAGYHNNMAAAYAMPFHTSQPHLPPIQSHRQPHPPTSQSYMPQSAREEFARYHNQPVPHPAERYNSSSHVSPQSALGGNMSSSSLLPQPSHSYQPSQAYVPPTSAPQGYPQRIAPAPPRTELASFSNNFSQAESRPPIWTSSETIPNIAAEAPRDQTRTHVVGSQGRRGILPSAPGRAAVGPTAVNGPAKNPAAPAKDADGKFPCPNCNKTYLHAKHLKRHLLRHTGDRPYMCVLCKDTFSRSDILKRHFQKCSVRRGNPTGASHLSNPAAHIKKSQAATTKSSTDSLNSTSNTTPGVAVNGFNNNVVGSGTISSNSSNFSEPPSISYTMANAPAANMHRPHPEHTFPSNGQAAVAPSNNGSWSLHNARNPMLFHQTSASPDQFPGATGTGDDKRNLVASSHQPGDDWNQMFQPSGNDNYMNPMFSTSMPAGYDSMHAHAEVKKEYQPHDGGSNGYYISSTSLGTDGTLGPLLWNLEVFQDDPFQFKANRLIDFCFPGGVQVSLHEQQNNIQLRSYLTADNVKHFLDLFTNFQGHFPFLHLPTFRFTDAYDGLILAVICIGAVYSDRISQSQVRYLMQKTKQGIQRTSRIFNTPEPDPTLHMRHSGVSSHSLDFEELQAILMLQTLFIWHGGPVERSAARCESKTLYKLARQYGMLEPVGPDHPAHSFLHNLSEYEHADPSKWVWDCWVEQEKRCRLMFLIFLLDAALTIYFNCPPQFDPSEIKVPLPCDDAAWEARTAEDCAQALGLRGPEAQHASNKSGSLRMKQPELNDAMGALYNTKLKVQPRTTNVYSKFIIVHALHMKIWQIQRQRTPGISFPMHDPMNSGCPSPVLGEDLHHSYNNSSSGHATPSTVANGTPTPGIPSSGTSTISNVVLRPVTNALIRWKRMWDEDIQLQYPVYDNRSSLTGRVGFCRDGVHFYWLARAFLHPNHSRDWQIPADVRFRQVFNGLRQVREWCRSDSAQRGEEPGSVGDIDERYGMEALELDMRKLFRPITEICDVPGVSTCG